MKTIIRLIILTMLVSITVSAESNPSRSGISSGADKTVQDTKKTDKDSTYEQRGTDKLPIFIKPASPINQDEIDYDTYEKHGKRTIERVTMWATIVLAAFTFLLWYATYSLAKDARKTADNQSKDMKDSLTIARDSVDATQKAAKAAQDSADNISMIEGANIFVEIKMQRWIVSETEKCTFTFIVSNIGRTPAIIHSACGHIIIDKKAPVDVCTEGNIDLPTGTMVHPRHITNDYRIKHKEIVINKTDSIRIRNKEASLLFYGRITYEDILSRIWVRGFCWEFYPTENGRFSIIRDDNLNYHKQGKYDT
jgi:hypothetical protein